jgi:hypothetical protein
MSRTSIRNNAFGPRPLQQARDRGRRQPQLLGDLNLTHIAFVMQLGDSVQHGTAFTDYGSA